MAKDTESGFQGDLDQILRALERAQHLFPKMRFCQLVLYIGEMARDFTEDSIYDVTDEEFLRSCLRIIEANETKYPPPAPSLD
jgi:hypothetical protein